MLRRSLLIGLVSLLAVAPGTAGAATLSSYNLRGWTVEAYSDDSTGQFSHCAAGVPYRNGIFLMFSVGRDYTWRMAFANPAWQLEQGAQYPIAYRIDKGPLISATAVAINPTLAAVELLDSGALFRQFQLGRYLKVKASGDNFKFQLANSSRALEATIDCTRRYVNAGGSSNPFAGNGVVPSPQNGTNPFAPSNPANPFAGNTPAPAPSPTTTPPAPAPNPATITPAPTPAVDTNDLFRVEAATLIANVLSASGIQGFTISPTIPAGMEAYQAVWSAPGLIGGVQVGPGVALNDAATMLISSDTQSCKGSFASAKLPSEAGMVRLKTACESNGGADSKVFHFDYVVLERPGGGVYVITTGELDGSGSKAEDSGARVYEASQRVLKK